MTCLLKRFVPFLLTLMIGLVLGSFLGRSSSTTTVPRNSSVNFVSFEPERRAYGCRYRNSALSTPLRFDYKPEPLYTEAARRNQIEGTVRVIATFNADGTVSNVTPLTFLPYGLTQEAKRAAEVIRFTPGTVNGQPITETKTIEYNFSLN